MRYKFRFFEIGRECAFHMVNFDSIPPALPIGSFIFLPYETKEGKDYEKFKIVAVETVLDDFAPQCFVIDYYVEWCYVEEED